MRVFALLLLSCACAGTTAPPTVAESLPMCTIAGRVVDEQPAPLAGVTIALTTSAPDTTTPTFDVISDAEGGFTLPALMLPPDATLVLYYADLIYAAPLPTCPPPRTYGIRVDMPGNSYGEPRYPATVQ